jgi:hypothetical protein
MNGTRSGRPDWLSTPPAWTDRCARAAPAPARASARISFAGAWPRASLVALSLQVLCESGSLSQQTTNRGGGGALQSGEGLLNTYLALRGPPRRSPARALFPFSPLVRISMCSVVTRVVPPKVQSCRSLTPTCASSSASSMSASPPTCPTSRRRRWSTAGRCLT